MIKKIIEKIKSPDREFTPIPFWFLNDDLTEEEIRRQLNDFCEKGVYGVVLHPRIGLPKSIPYLSDRFMHYIRYAVEVAAELGMYIVLYDEAMYPSGSAHGMVVAENPKYAVQGIILTDDVTQGKVIAQCKSGKYIVQVDGKGTIRGIHFGEDDREENAPRAADLLSQESVDTFIRLTHQRYFDVVGEYFGSTIIGFFTDEPSLLGRLGRSACYPWTWEFEDDFINKGGKLEELESLFEGKENESTRLYQKMIFEREQKIYYESIHRFCTDHGIALMGHPHRGDDIECEKHFDIPGQDIVWRYIGPEKDGLSGEESAQGKCSSDAARLRGSRRNSNECFGVCVRNKIPWYLTGDDMKWYIDYLGVRGVNLFIPHAFYYSVAGKRKDERPPDVGPNNIWWEHYDVISAYMKRISYLMTDSVNEAKVCVMCENRKMRVDEVREFYQNQVEFNYLPYIDFQQGMVQNSTLQVGNNTYEYVYCDDLKLVQGVKRINGVESLPYRDLYTEHPCPDLRLSRFKKEGVRMIFLVNEGDSVIETPVAIDGETSIIAMDLWNCTYWRENSCVKNGKTHFYLKLGFRESILLMLDDKGDFDAKPSQSRKYVSLDYQLISHDQSQFVKSYSGSLDIKSINKEPLWISVNAEEMVECFVNGDFAGFSLWNKHEFEISKFLKVGVNEVVLKVTGSAVNRYTEHRIEYGLL